MGDPCAESLRRSKSKLMIRIRFPHPDKQAKQEQNRDLGPRDVGNESRDLSMPGPASRNHQLQEVESEDQSVNARLAAFLQGQAARDFD